MKWGRARIREEVEARGITHLVHFTPFSNLRGIVEHGLRSRVDLEAAELPFLGTDALRLDDRLEATSLSVTDLNRSMLLNKQRRWNGAWAILHIDPSVLWTVECEFCFRNAASSEMRWRQHRSSPRNFSQMFEDPSDGYRERYGLSLAQPTYQDAEVQVFEPIPPNRIIGVVVMGHTSLEREAQELMDHLNQVDGGDRDAISWEVYESHLSQAAAPTP